MESQSLIEVAQIKQTAEFPQSESPMMTKSPASPGSRKVILLLLGFILLSSSAASAFLLGPKLFSSSPSPDGSSVSRQEDLPALDNVPTATSETPLPSTTPIAMNGNVIPYRIEDGKAIFQLVAQSQAGNVTEMLVWTDLNTQKNWSPFESLVTIDRSEINSILYAQFKDDQGNISPVYTGSLDPSAEENKLAE